MKIFFCPGGATNYMHAMLFMSSDKLHRATCDMMGVVSTCLDTVPASPTFPATLQVSHMANFSAGVLPSSNIWRDDR